MTTQDILDERYGRTRSPARRWTIGTIIAVAIIAFGAFAWMTYSSALDDVTADVTAFAVVDAHSVTVNFQISAPAGASVACALEADDEQHGVVGWRVVEYEASDLPVQAVQESIPTVALATTGLVNSCWVT